MSTASDNNICAACGAEGDGLKNCASCKEVKYCSVACQRAHWPRHKKDCKRRAAELKGEALFKEHAKEDCPICFLPMPGTMTSSIYQSCCGKIICRGCLIGIMKKPVVGNPRDGNIMGDCPFCRETEGSNEERMARLKKRMEKNDAEAYYDMGCRYNHGLSPLPVDEKIALDLWLKAAKLGCAAANLNIGNAYFDGKGGVVVDKKKAKHHYEIAAMGGIWEARYQLGRMEIEAGNANLDERIVKRGFKHYPIKQGYLDGFVTKDEYTAILLAYQKSKEEMKSDTRQRAERSEEVILKMKQTQNEEEKRALEAQLDEIFLGKGHSRYRNVIAR